METKIALPDSYATPEVLQRVLNQQGYELSVRKNPFGLTVQQIRLIDVFVITPILLYTATRQELPRPLRVTLLVLGVATFVYNGYHYGLNAKK